ncbi:MAG TPA: formylglycine-generating enzyme family protein, partial [Usitatibacter sp.]|nr:formylglycine-generating enzyme family protein [Usitatibacter sp.]
LREDEHRAHAGIPSDLRDCRDAITGHKPLDCARNFFFRGLPEAAWSPELNAKVLEVAETRVAMYDAFSSEMQETASDETWLQQHRRSLGSRPLRVLTSGNHAVGHLETKPPDTPKHLEYEREMTLAQARWLELSSNARQVFPRDSSEYIQFDAPQTLIDAVREVYDQATGAPPAGAPSAPAPGTAFRDCPECPEMVVVPAGSFTMGSSAAEKSWAASHGGSAGSVADEAPQHRVSLRAFALGKYVVTRGEYAAFVHETGRSSADACRVSSMPKAAARAGANWENPGFGQTDRDPAVCVSWHDARAYAEWLNDKVRPRLGLTGRGPYRLPSEAEWEYAARAGTATRFWWGDDDGGADGHAWYEGNSGGRTHPVGSKPANAFGLDGMAGNVWQWTQDCYAEDYGHAPTDGSAAEAAGDCGRVDRGGSWLYPAWLLRSATREWNPPGYRDVIMGFRLARALP